MPGSTPDSASSGSTVVRPQEREGQAAPVASRREFAVFFLVIGGLLLAANVFTLTSYPAVHTDEAWYANLAQNWITTGNRWTTLDIGPYPEGRGQGSPFLGILPTRIAIQLWGLSLQAIRLPSLLAGLALLGIVAAIGQVLWPGRSGLLAVLVLALLPLFILGSHLARPEIWLALVALAALGCSLLGWKRGQPLWDAAAAVLTLVSVELHQNGAAFAIGLAATYPARYGRQAWRQWNTLLFFSISLLGALFYFYRHAGMFLPAQGAGSILTTYSSHPIPILSGNPLEWMVNELARYLFYFRQDQLGMLLLGIGIVATLRRRSSADRVLLAWLAGSALGIMLLISRISGLYLLPMICVGALLVGHWMALLLQRPEPWARRVAPNTLGVLMLPLFLLILRSGTNRPVEWQRELQEHVPCERILGSNQYWLAFPQCDYRSIDLINHYHHLHGLSLEESMAAIRPDYLIVDGTIVEKLGEDFGAGGSMMGYYALPAVDFYRFLEEHTTLESILPINGRGHIQIRKILWEMEP